MPPNATFREADLTPHLDGEVSTEGLAISASEDGVWALVSKTLFRIEPDGTVVPALRAPGTQSFTHLSTSGRSVAVTTYSAGLSVSHHGTPFRRLSCPVRGKQVERQSLLVRADGGLWLELGVGQPVQSSWWQCGPTGEWTTEPESLAERYGLRRSRRRFSSPCLGDDGTLYALVDQTSSADEDAEAPEGALYVRRQTLCALASAEEGWEDHIDLHAAGLPVIRSGVDQDLWLGSAHLASVRDDEGRPAWLVGRPDGVHRFVNGRASTVTFEGRAQELHSDGERTVVVRELGRDDTDVSSLWLSRDGGARFEPMRSLAPRELRSVTVHRGAVFLGLVGRERPGITPTSAWIVRVA